MAVLCTDGPLLIVAGAGAGKTKTICYRILHLIKQGIAPENILAITFTNKAAKEMRDRVQKILHTAEYGMRLSYYEHPFVSTFHALGVFILRENAAIAGLKKNFTILDRNDSLRVIKEALAELGLDPKQHNPNSILSRISREKGGAVTLDAFEEMGMKSYGARSTGEVWRIYEQILRKEDSLDFDDLLLKSAALLKNNREVREKYQKQWSHIHVDEYQDTNAVQNSMMISLAGAHQNVCAVGDADQTIYTWRGADIENIMSFEKEYPQARVILLEQNYRSTQNILAAANDIIKKNTLRKEKNLYTKSGEGEKITILSAYGEAEEAAHVALSAATLIAMGVRKSEIAVLYRVNFLSRALEEAFLNAHVPYQVLGIRFFERKEVKDILAYIRAALNPASAGDLKRIINTPPRGIGKISLLSIFAGEEYKLPAAKREQIEKFRDVLAAIKTTAETKRPSEVIAFVMKKSGIETSLDIKKEDDRERLENMRELVTLSMKYDTRPLGEGIEQFLTDAALASDQDALMQNTEAVKLMTIHASKGLEFDCVFITGLEEGIFPNNARSNKNLAEFEEERRLFYVALTRARKKVCLSYASVRTIFGQQDVQIPSEFISDIPENLLEYESARGTEEPRHIIYI